MLGTSKKNKEQISEFTKVYGEILHGMHRDLTEFKSLVSNNDIAVKKLDDEINKKEIKNQIELEEHLNKIKKIIEDAGYMCPVLASPEELLGEES